MRAELQIGLARGHRRAPTVSEALLWEFLRDEKLDGLRFRRQHPVQFTRFIADFCCVALKLIVEIDGGYHNEPEQAERDRVREMLITESGYTFVRFSDRQVLSTMPEVLELIREAVHVLERGLIPVGAPTPPAPLPRSAGEGGVDAGNDSSVDSPVLVDAGTAFTPPSPAQRGRGAGGVGARPRGMAKYKCDHQQAVRHLLADRPHAR